MLALKPSSPSSLTIWSISKSRAALSGMGSRPSSPEPCCHQQTSLVVQETRAVSWHLPSLWMADGLSVTRARVVDKSDSEIGVIWGGEAPFPPSEVCPHQSTLPPSSLLTGLLVAYRQRQAYSGRRSRTGFLARSGKPGKVRRPRFLARTQEMG